MTSKSTGMGRLIDESGTASGVALLDEGSEGGSGPGLEPWRGVQSPLCDDGKKFSDEDEEDLDGDDAAEDADEEDAEFDDDDDADDEGDDMFGDEGEDDDGEDDMDDDDDDDF